MNSSDIPQADPASPHAIAVVGIGCRYPGAADLRELWENILGRRRQFRRMPDVRLPLAEYHDADPAAADKTYGDRAALIDGFAFDWQARFVPRLAYETADIAHWLALDTAIKCVENAGLTRKTAPGEKTGVILGNTLTGEHTRATAMRQRWPFVRKALRAAARARGLDESAIAALESTMQDYYQSVFAPTTEDSLSGGLSNTIAGRIANYFDFHGGGYTVDGACSSSLIAVATAAGALASGELDFALAGGVDISLDTFELIGFAKTGALTPADMAVYDRRASGFIPGEGCGFVALRRLADARAAGDRVYAVLRGWGISSDGKGGLTAPNRDGQATALRRAYARAGYPAASVDFFEGHGTGTPVGDRTEIEGIALALEAHGAEAVARAAGQPRRHGLTSFKSLVGHTKAAAGVGGFIKAVLAVNRRVLPPTCGCDEPSPVFAERAPTLFPIVQGERHPADAVLRAGVSAMGFGGINCHVTLESGDAPAAELDGALDERTLMAHAQDGELFVFDAASAAGLRARLAELVALADGIALAELADLAAELGRAVQAAPAGPRWRAAVLAATPAELAERLAALDAALMAQQPAPGRPWSDAARQLWFGQVGAAPRLGFIFPGQGAQQLQMARSLVERHGWARELVACADRWLAEVGAAPVSPLMFVPLDRAADGASREAWAAALARTEVAQPAICLAALLWLTRLRRLGLDAEVLAGHSLGELVAFHAAGAFDAEALIKLAALRGRAMAAPAGTAGAMASLGCDAARAGALIGAVGGYLAIANLNSPRQTVVSGERAAIDAVVALAQANGLTARLLPVSNAFHSDFVAPAALALEHSAPLPARPLALRARLLSGIDAAAVGAELALAPHFGRQITAQVDFVRLAGALAAAADQLVEVGPGRVLSGLIRDCTGTELALPVAGRAGSQRDLHAVLARAWCAGARVDWAELQADRLLRPFVPAAARSFIDNPCERPFRPSRDWSAEPALAGVGAADRPQRIDAEFLAGYLARRADFLAQVIRADLRLPPAPGTVAAPVLAASAVGAGASGGPVGAATLAVASAGGPNAAAPAGLPAAASPAAPADPRAVVLARLIALVAERTGFPAASMPPGARLLDDLNLDSIKAGELVAAAALDLGLTGGAVDASLFANASLAEIADALLAAGAGRTAVAAAPASVASAAASAVAAASAAPAASVGAATVAPAASASADPTGLLLDLVAERTGFARAGLGPQLRLLDDLNLDSIKAGELVAAAASALGLAGAIDPSLFANASIAELADAFARLAGAERPSAPPAPAAAEAPAASAAAPASAVPAATGAVAATAPIAPAAAAPRPGWVRAFRMRPVAEPLAAAPADWTGARVLVLHDPADAALAAAFQRALLAAGAAEALCLSHAVAAIRHSHAEPAFTHRIGLLPRQGAAAPTLADCVARLQPFATLPRRPGPGSALALVQFGGGDFGASAGALDQVGTAAFAASLHLERPDLALRAIDVDPALDDATLVRAVLAELAAPGGFARAGYDRAGRRSVPRPQVERPADWPARGLDWQPGEVVLVTGGARGITAECALALARRHRLTLALVGSSAPEGEVATTLARFAAEGLTARYFRCDVSRADAVSALVAEVGATLGPVAALVHGAAVNRPRRAEQVDGAAALAEIGPKLQGALNLLAALAATPPRLVAGFSSIIGVTGMTGNAWYAYSNESLDLALRRFAAAHPGTQAVSMAYSVWAEVGMGARMGSTDALARMGIEAIPPAAGVAHFLDLIERDPGCSQIVIAARLGGLDTWAPAWPPRPAAARYLDQVIDFTPGVELVLRTRLTLARDPYVADHIYKGSALFPTVFGLEAMAQAAAWLTGRGEIAALTIEDIRLDRPIVVDPAHGCLIELRARVLDSADPGQPAPVEVGIATEATGFARAHFAARFVFDATPPAPVAEPELPAAPLPLRPATDLYGWLLFQGPRFQRLRQIWRLDARELVFDAELRDLAPAPGRDEAWLLGDPYFRDALLQTPQLIVARHLSLPVHIGRIEIDDLRLVEPGRRRGVAVLDRPASGVGDQMLTRVWATDGAGRVIERLSDYRLAVLEDKPDAPTPDRLAAPEAHDADRLAQALTEAARSLGHAAPALAFGWGDWHGLDAPARQAAQAPLIARALAGAGLGAATVERDAERRPQLVGVAGDLSIAHDEHGCLVVAGSARQGCDLAPLLQRDGRAGWLALLGAARAAPLDRLVADGDSLDLAGTRLWAASEALRKAGGAPLHDLRPTVRSGAGVLLAGSAGDGVPRTVLTLVWRGIRGPQRIVAVVLAEPAPRAAAALPALADPRFAGFDGSVYSAAPVDGPQGQVGFELRFPLSFRETAYPSRSLYFTHYAVWMGKLREAACQPVYDQLVDQFSTGRWGMVTNRSETRVLGSASAHDIVAGRFWIDRVHGSDGSTLELCFEWSAERPDGRREPIALSRMGATWVEILDHGIVQARPFPDYYQRFIDRAAPAGAGAGWNTGQRADPGRLLRAVPAGPAARVPLAEEVFDTTLEDANLVGNIYFANYYLWQGRCIDRYFQRLAPDLYRGTAEQGELRCAWTQVDHLREAMPFDRIVVRLSLGAVHEHGVRLLLDYFRADADGQRHKLAWGEHDAVWMRRDAAGDWQPAPLPEVFLGALLAQAPVASAA
ncbi:type I polyketide synthase [Derxia lacustris]|uniref:type I polyketide synthase n=1 Tax=Derxia lacustris TaxID=764842 RepID=UPI000A175BC8|nr:type I polyketide synthase [Derxia lacustris]